MQVMLYTKRHCPQCSATKRQLDTLGIDYCTVDIEEHPAILDDLRMQGFRQAPVVITSNDSWSGYRPDKLQELAAQFSVSSHDNDELSAFADESLWA